MNFAVLVFLFAATITAAPISTETYDTQRLNNEALAGFALLPLYIVLASGAAVIQLGFLLSCAFNPNNCGKSTTRLDQSSTNVNILNNINLEKLIAAHPEFFNLHLPNLQQQAGYGKTSFALPPVFTMVKRVVDPDGETRPFPIYFENSNLNVPPTVGHYEMSDTRYLDIASRGGVYLDGLPWFGELSVRDNFVPQVKQLAPLAVDPETNPA